MDVFLGVIFLASSILHGEQHFVTTSYSAPPSPTGCVLVAKMDVWLNVYQEDQQGNKAVKIFTELNLKQNESQRVAQVPNDRIVYNFKVVPNGPYHGETHVACTDGDRIIVP